MKKVKSIFGTIWAVLAIPIVLATFMGMDFWARALAEVTSVEISPWYTGGEIVRTIDHQDYQTRLHRPVFDWLIGERDEGFIQIDWAPSRGVLPSTIDEEVDFDSDGKVDFRIRLDTRGNRASLVSKSERVISVGSVLNLDEVKAVRVRLRNST